MVLYFLLSLRRRGGAAIIFPNNKLLVSMSKPRFVFAIALACCLIGLTPVTFAQVSDARDASTQNDIERAQVLYESGRPDDALALVSRVLERAAGDAEARFLQGLIFADMNRRDDAIEVFSALTNDFPELPEPWNNLAVLFAENGEFDKARQALLAAIQTHPSYSTAHENLGDLYARMASMAYDRALEQDNGNESARLKLSAVNGLFSVPAQAPVQVAAAPVPSRAVVKPTPEPANAAPIEPEPEPVEPDTTEPEPVEPEPVAQTPTVTEPLEPVTTAAVTPPAMQPAPAVVPTPAANPDDVAAAVRRWAGAWSAQDVDTYLDSYAPEFRPANGASRASWNRYRRDRLTKPSFIDVQITDLAIDVQSSDRATAEFAQRYRSDNYEDQVRKTLAMVNVDGRWRIASETSQ